MYKNGPLAERVAGAALRPGHRQKHHSIETLLDQEDALGVQPKEGLECAKQSCRASTLDLISILQRESLPRT